MSKARATLEKYLPPQSLDLVVKLLHTEPVQLKIVRPRKTKFGDYRFPKPGDERHRISLNSNLNPFAFLITLIHEMAHLTAFKYHGRHIKPHGEAWQKEFLRLSEPFLKEGIFPPELERHLTTSLHKGSASSCTDLNLFRALKKYDPEQKDRIHLEQLPVGDHFQVDSNKIFKKGPRLRKRFRCLNLNNGREYMVHPLAEVQPVEPKNKLKSA